MMTGEYQPDLEITKPSAARMYDYALGGYHNYAIDRQALEQVLAINPDVVLIARANRAFLRRAVTFLLDQGIDQFLDIGSGIPTVGNVHEIVQSFRQFIQKRQWYMWILTPLPLHTVTLCLKGIHERVQFRLTFGGRNR